MKRYSVLILLFFASFSNASESFTQYCNSLKGNLLTDVAVNKLAAVTNRTHEDYEPALIGIANIQLTDTITSHDYGIVRGSNILYDMIKNTYLTGARFNMCYGNNGALGLGSIIISAEML